MAAPPVLAAPTVAAAPTAVAGPAGTGAGKARAQRKKELSGIHEFTKAMNSSAGFIALQEMVRKNPQLMCRDPTTAKHLDLALPLAVSMTDADAIGVEGEKPSKLEVEGGEVEGGAAAERVADEDGAKANSDPLGKTDEELLLSDEIDIPEIPEDLRLTPEEKKADATAEGAAKAKPDSPAAPQATRSQSPRKGAAATPIAEKKTKALEDMRPGERPPHHHMLTALITQYYEWNHRSFVKMPLTQTVQLLQRMKHDQTFTTLRDFEGRETRKREREQDDLDRRQRAETQVADEQLQEVEAELALAQQRQAALERGGATTAIAGNDGADPSAMDEDFFDEMMNDQDLPTNDFLPTGTGGVGMVGVGLMPDMDMGYDVLDEDNARL